MKIQNYKTDELVPYEHNPRINDNAVDLVANSIREFGFKQPIVIDRNRVIIAGHTRWKAAKELGLKEVPCIMADDLTPSQVKAYRLADNKVAEASEWDYDLLEEELEGILDIDMSDFGFETESEDTAEAVEDEYEPDIPPEPISKTGQIYQLGDHRLMVGDSTSAADVDALCNGDMMDLVVTDPPYNVDIENSQGMKIENDDMSSDDFYDFLVAAFTNMNDHLKAGGAFYIWHASRTQRAFEDALNAVGLEVREQLIWNKNALVLGRQDYQWKHEPCFYGWKDGASHYFVNTRTLTTVIDEDPIDLDVMKKDQLKDLLTRILGGVSRGHGDQREEAGSERPASDDEADQTDRAAGKEFQPDERTSAGPFRRQRIHDDRLRAAGPQMLHDGERPAIRGRDHRPMGKADRAEGGAAG